MDRPRLPSAVWAPIARYFAELPAKYDEGEAYDRYMRARRTQIDMLMQMAPHIRGLLTKEQRRKLPAFVVNVLDPRYLVSIRNGTSMYVGGTSFAGGGGPVFLSESEAMIRLIR